MATILPQFDEINSLEARYKRVLDKATESYKHYSTFDEDMFLALDNFEDRLIEAYVEGFEGARAMLNGEDKKIPSVSPLSKTYNGDTVADKFINAYSIKSEADVQRLVDSEIHRVFNEGSFDYAVLSGMDIYKRWVTMKDDKVRETHDYLEGRTVELLENFITFDGDEALAPGGFNNAENNVNCRCYLQYIAV